MVVSVVIRVIATESNILNLGYFRHLGSYIYRNEITKINIRQTVGRKANSSREEAEKTSQKLEEKKKEKRRKKEKKGRMKRNKKEEGGGQGNMNKNNNNNRKKTPTHRVEHEM